jgi:hypothetical protein
VIWNHFNAHAIVQQDRDISEENCFLVDATWDMVERL